jgi:hypothetical protein
MSIDPSTSTTTGTSRNRTPGDRFTREMVGGLKAAGGWNPNRQKHTQQIQEQMAGLDPTSDQYLKLKAKLDEASAKKTSGEYGLESMTPLEYYPEQAHVEQDPYTLESIEARAQQAREGTMTSGAQGYVSDVLGGKYLSEQNPYLKGMYQDAASGVTSDYLGNVLPQLEARFANAGGRGGAYQAALDRANAGLGDELSGLASNLYGAAYMQERDLMQNAAELAPTMQQMGYYDTDELERAGRTKEDYERIKLQDLMDRFYFAQDEPFMRMDRLTGGAATLPMAAGAGETTYDSRTLGTSIYHKPELLEPALWKQILTGII